MENEFYITQWWKKNSLYCEAKWKILLVASMSPLLYKVSYEEDKKNFVVALKQFVLYIHICTYT